MHMDYPGEVQETKKEMILKEIMEEIAGIFRDDGNLDILTGRMNLVKLRQLHQVLFDEAVKAGREKFGDDFSISILRKRIDNTYEHVLKNLCPLSIDVCNRNSCDNYDEDCVSRKIRDQINRIASEILSPSSFKHLDQPIEFEAEELLKVF